MNDALRIDPALYQQGFVSLDLTGVEFDPLDCTFGVQVHEDGRVWVCVNGQTFLRFKPHERRTT